MSKLLSIEKSKYRITLINHFKNPLIIEQLLEIPKLVKDNKLSIISNNREKVYLSSLDINGQTINIVIKAYKPYSRLKLLYNHQFGGRAFRSFSFANHLIENNINTPEPIACIERFRLGKLIESYYITKFIDNKLKLSAKLSDIFWKNQDNDRLMQVIQPLAKVIREMHDSGFTHGDLSNVNILIDDSAEKYDVNSFCFIDLDRGAINDNISWKNRAKDLQRIYLPSAYLRYFWYMYYQDGELPYQFSKQLLKYHKRYRRHCKTRKYRHPIKYLKNKKKIPKYPNEKDLWLWDEKSAQAMIMHLPSFKNPLRSKHNFVDLIYKNLKSLPRIKRYYAKQKAKSFQTKVEMKGRTGIALHHHRSYWQAERVLWEELGKPSVLIRMCAHEGKAYWEDSIFLVEQYAALKTPVMVAFLQNRDAVLNIKKEFDRNIWQQMLKAAIPRIHDKVIAIEVGHAINRVKWGIWHIKEYQALLNAFKPWLKIYSNLPLTGPATIDFDYHQANHAMQSIPKGINLAAMSVHLYVDRRGIPENYQGQYATVEKTALLKAMADTSAHCQNKLIISEVNWSLQKTGVWSPIGGPYLRPCYFKNNPGVNEEQYTKYMIRYLSLCLCSAHVDRVFWWRLSAHGYGLVSDHPQSLGEKRPAYYAFKQWIKKTQNSHFIKRLPSSKNTYLLLFQENNTFWILAWCLENKIHLSLEGDFTDIYGLKCSRPAYLNDTPLYITNPDFKNL